MSQAYLSLEAELHDAFWAEDDASSELHLMADFLTTHDGPALEIGCGSGRLLLPLLDWNLPVEGLELSPDMLALCRERAAGQGLDPVLHEGDMSAWRPSRRYSSLLVPAFTLQLATDPAATLRHWHDWLEEEGRLYLTLFIPFAELDGEQPENVWYPDHETRLPDGRRATLETRHRIDPEKHLLHREHRYRLEGDPPREHQSSQTLHWFTPEEIPGLLANAGFEILTAFPDFTPELPLPTMDTPDFGGILTCHAVRR